MPTTTKTRKDYYNQILNTVKEVDPHNKVEILIAKDLEHPIDELDKFADDPNQIEEDFLIGTDNVYAGIKISDLEGLEEGEQFDTFIHRTLLSAILHSETVNDAPPPIEPDAVIEDNSFVADDPDAQIATSLNQSKGEFE